MPAAAAVPPHDPADGDPSSDAPKRDGRRTHIIDRALDYVALADLGLSAARIARKRRKSAGYVSIALRLGRAIEGMEPDEVAALRSPRVTWKLAQRIVRDGVDVVSIRHQLRSAVGGFSTHNQDGRRNRKGRTAPTDGQRAIGTAWGWDAAWFARDPLGFAEAHLRYLGGAHQSVHARATRVASTRGVERVPVGQGIRMLQRSIAAAQASSAPERATSATPETRQALAILEILARKLAEARDEVAAFRGEPSTGAPARARTPARPTRDPADGAATMGRRGPSDDGGLDATIEAELRD